MQLPSKRGIFGGMIGCAIVLCIVWGTAYHGIVEEVRVYKQQVQKIGETKSLSETRASAMLVPPEAASSTVATVPAACGEDKDGNLPCMHGGICYVDAGVMRCLCPPEWEGTKCEAHRKVERTVARKEMWNSVLKSGSPKPMNESIKIQCPDRRKNFLWMLSITEQFTQGKKGLLEGVIWNSLLERTMVMPSVSNGKFEPPWPNPRNVLRADKLLEISHVVNDTVFPREALVCAQHSAHYNERRVQMSVFVEGRCRSGSFFCTYDGEDFVATNGHIPEDGLDTPCIPGSYTDAKKPVWNYRFLPKAVFDHWKVLGSAGISYLSGRLHHRGAGLDVAIYCLDPRLVTLRASNKFTLSFMEPLVLRHRPDAKLLHNKLMGSVHGANEIVALMQFEKHHFVTRDTQQELVSEEERLFHVYRPTESLSLPPSQRLREVAVDIRQHLLHTSYIGIQWRTKMAVLDYFAKRGDDRLPGAQETPLLQAALVHCTERIVEVALALKKDQSINAIFFAHDHHHVDTSMDWKMSPWKTAVGHVIDALQHALHDSFETVVEVDDALRKQYHLVDASEDALVDGMLLASSHALITGSAAGTQAYPGTGECTCTSTHGSSFAAWVVGMWQNNKSKNNPNKKSYCF